MILQVMTAEQALALIKKFLGSEDLTEIQQTVFRQCWAGHSYNKIASQTQYAPAYIKQVGLSLWQMLSNKLGKRVTKQNLQLVCQEILSNQKKRESPLIAQSAPRDFQNIPNIMEPPSVRRAVGDVEKPFVQGGSIKSFAVVTPSSLISGFGLTPKISFQAEHHPQDWGDALNPELFSGRTEELATIKHWIVQDRCRLVMLLGMGGIGKTVLAVSLAHKIQHQFDCLIWRSLRNAPPVQDLLADLLQFLSQQPQIVLPETVDGRISQLLQYLRSSRCLLILDNAESILRQGARTGRYRDGYWGYEQMLSCLGETSHQSAVLLTSREKPRGLTTLEGEFLPVRALQLTAIPALTCQKILQLSWNLWGSESEWTALAEHYAGNLLLLKMVAPLIRDFFDSNVAKFLEALRRGPLIFDDVRNLLDQHFNRLSALEKQVMYCFVVKQEPVSLAQLTSYSVPDVRQSKILDVLASLQNRALIQQTSSGFMAAPVLVEYMIERLAIAYENSLNAGQAKLA